MKQMMRVGAKCSGCGEYIPVGKTEIEPSASPSVLHAQLRREGWNDEYQDCLDVQCKATTYVPVDKTALLEPVEISPDGAETP